MSSDLIGKARCHSFFEFGQFDVSDEDAVNVPSCRHRRQVYENAVPSTYSDVITTSRSKYQRRGLSTLN